MGLNETDLFLMLAPREEWKAPSKDAMMEQIREVMKDFPGVEYSFTQPIEMRTSEMLTGSRGDLAIKVFGPDLAALGQLSEDIRAVVAKVSGATEVFTVAGDKVRYLQTDIDRMAVGVAGLSTQTLQEEMRARLEGLGAGIVTDNQRRIPILIRGGEDLHTRPELFGDVGVATESGGIVHVADVARITQPEGPVRIQRENASRFGTIQANVSGRDLVGFVEAAQAGAPVTSHSGQRSPGVGGRNIAALDVGRISFGSRFRGLHRTSRHCGSQRPGTDRSFQSASRPRHAHPSGGL